MFFPEFHTDLSRYKQNEFITNTHFFAAIMRPFGPGSQNFDTWDLSSVYAYACKILSGSVNVCCSYSRKADSEQIHIAFSRARWNLTLWGYWSVAGLKGFWWTLVQFSGSTSFRQQIFRTLFVGVRQNLAVLWVWPTDTYSPNFVNFGPGVPRCHAATCISPSLMHLFFRTFFHRNFQYLHNAILTSFVN